MVETTFAKGQRRPFRRAQTLGIPQPENQLGDILELNKAESVSAISGFDREENEGPNAAAESAHSKYQSQQSYVAKSIEAEIKDVLLPKEPYEIMDILAIQNLLSQDYHFLKWRLVENLELQERELSSVAFKTTFSDSVNQLLAQETNTKLGMKVSPYDTTKLDMIHVINLQQMMVKQSELRENLNLPGTTKQQDNNVSTVNHSYQSNHP